MIDETIDEFERRVKRLALVRDVLGIPAPAPDRGTVTTASFQTLQDGTLVDYERDQGGPLRIHAGQTLDPAARPLILTLTIQDVREMVFHLNAFLVTREVLGDAGEP